MATKARAGLAEPAKGRTRAAEAGGEATAPSPEAAAGPVAGEGRLSALAAAAKVLGETGTALTCRELVGAMAAKGYWTSPGGKTPEATLHAAIRTEIKKKGDTARFYKAAPGRFAAAGAPGTLAPGAAGRRKAPVWKRKAGAVKAITPPGHAAG
jgi:hypothetical protein